jgi:Na+/proline symporter
MPKYLSHILPVGLLGIVVAGMLAAFMSTHDSYLLCWSTIITNDIIEPLSNNVISSKTKILLTRLIIFVLGIYVFYWGMFYEGTDAIWDYLGITGAIYFTGAISVVVLGLYWKKASSTGAILSLLGGLSSIIGLEPIRIYLGINLSDPALIGLLALSFSIFLMIIGSLIFPDKNKDFIEIFNKCKEVEKKQDNILRKYYLFESFVIIVLVLSYIVYAFEISALITWKLSWQIIFILTIALFISMFIRFTYGGFKDLKKLLADNLEE